MQKVGLTIGKLHAKMFPKNTRRVHTGSDLRTMMNKTTTLYISKGESFGEAGFSG